LEKIQRYIEWKPKVTINQGLSEMVRWIEFNIKSQNAYI
jgi:dTDP-D-glucose 4,6-dehydratase